MFIESARPETIQQAIERTEREAEDAWAVWRVSNRSSLYGVHRWAGGFGRELLSREAGNRLPLLRDAYERAGR